MWWLLALVAPLLLLQRQLHREIQALFLLVTRRGEISLALFSLLFFPGVLIHEGSHFLMARLLGVKTGRFSLVPRPLKGGKLQLGFVETSATDIFRDALIGTAPLLAGGAFVAYAGLYHLGLPALWERLASGGSSAWLAALSSFQAPPDFWLWFYLTLTVSSTMLPSTSDRRAWLPLSLVGGLVLAISLLVGAGPWLFQHLAPYLNQAFQAAAVVFGITVLLHLVLLPPLWLLRRLLSRITGLEVVA